MSTEQDLVKWFFGQMREMIREELRAVQHGDEWIDQYRSPLKLPNQKFSRRHCAIVKRRVEAGLPGAQISPDGKQYFLTTAALSDEALHPVVSTRPVAVPEDDDPDGTGIYERQLLERVRSK
jgi:hypothetical protein